MAAALDPDEYFDDVLYFADPGGGRVLAGTAARWQAWWRAQSASLEERCAGLAEIARRQGFVITTAQAATAGITRARARTLVRAGTWAAPQRGTLTVLDPRAGTPTDHWTRERRAHALATTGAVLVNPRHAVAHRSGAILHGLPTLGVPTSPELSVPPRHTKHRPGAHEATLCPADLCRWWGVPVTTVARTVADLLRTDRRDGLIAADAALHEHLVSRVEVAAVLERMQRWRGVTQARELLALANPLAESPLESLTRLALHDSGFPPPQLQVEIAVPGRRVPYRVDLLWPQYRLILEVDGLGKYDDVALRRERRREAELRQLGYRIERALWADVVDRWDETSALLASALR